MISSGYNTFTRDEMSVFAPNSIDTLYTIALYEDDVTLRQGDPCKLHSTLPSVTFSIFQLLHLNVSICPNKILNLITYNFAPLSPGHCSCFPSNKIYLSHNNFHLQIFTGWFQGENFHNSFQEAWICWVNELFISTHRSIFWMFWVVNEWSCF